MKYLCLCYYDTDAFAQLDEAHNAAVGEACRPHDEALKASGKLAIQASLDLPDAACHFVPQNGRPRRHDGPYLEGPRQVGAFFILDAESAELAQAAASKHAAANYGEDLGFAVEVRACEVFETYATH